ncbi:MAG: Rrf2 family transcriptional regulator [Planctomycetota bacterium]|jgi:Rrf2 family protein
MTDLDAKTRYALLAALDLAEHYQPGTCVKVREIAARTGAPAKYLVHILLALKRKALVNSTRGPKGGYWLLRRPGLISAAEVIEAVASGRDGRAGQEADDPYDRAIDLLWAEAERRQRAFLAEVSLADLVASSAPE